MLKKFLSTGCCLLMIASSFGQTISQKIQKAFTQFEKDSQLKYATSSLYIIDANTGVVIFEKNSRMGLAPASTQKIITAATAFELLGKGYQYKTEFSYDGEIRDSVLIGDIYIKGQGDPTLGSWRYSGTKPAIIQAKLIDALHKRKIYMQKGSLAGIIDKFEDHSIPDGWIWQDIGNYYGAAVGCLNWNENQYDLILRPGRNAGDPVKLIRTEPPVLNEFINELKSGAKNSSDNGYIYFEPGKSVNHLKGEIPCCTDTFRISGSVANSDYFTLACLSDLLFENKFNKDRSSFHLSPKNNFSDTNHRSVLFTHYSPALDSIIYWFLRESINLYGEALLKTMAWERQGLWSSNQGIITIKEFWKQKGLDPEELNMYDGSGLSPQNRITTHAQVEVLKYARKQSWFPAFYEAIPDYNNMKLKSGTISDVKGFSGYVSSKHGGGYIVSFIVNNYNGSASGLVNKMYRVLDILK